MLPHRRKIKDTSGLLEGDDADARRLAMFYSPEDVRAKTKALRAIIHQMAKALGKIARFEPSCDKKMSFQIHTNSITFIHLQAVLHMRTTVSEL